MAREVTLGLTNGIQLAGQRRSEDLSNLAQLELRTTQIKRARFGDGVDVHNAEASRLVIDDDLLPEC